MNTTPAEHLREAILDVLAKSETPLSSAEIYERVDCADSKQSVAAQINYLKKSGQIISEMTDSCGVLHMLDKRPAAVSGSGLGTLDAQIGADAETDAETDNSQPVAPTPPLDMPDADLHRIVWSQPHGNATRFLTLTITDAQPRLNTSGAFAIDPAMLRQMAELIEVLQQRAAA